MGPKGLPGWLRRGEGADFVTHSTRSANAFVPVGGNLRPVNEAELNHLEGRRKSRVGDWICSALSTSSDPTAGSGPVMESCNWN